MSLDLPQLHTQHTQPAVEPCALTALEAPAASAPASAQGPEDRSSPLSQYIKDTDNSPSPGQCVHQAAKLFLSPLAAPTEVSDPLRGHQCLCSPRPPPHAHGPSLVRLLSWPQQAGSSPGLCASLGGSSTLQAYQV